MPKLKIDGVGTVQVDDAFLKMPRDQQDAFVAHVAENARQGVKAGGGEPIGASPATVSPPSPSAGMSPDLARRIAFDDAGPGPDVPAMPYGEQMANVAGFLGRSADQGVRAAADGMTFGLADRLAAGGDTLTKGGSYAGNLAQERARTDAAGAGVPGLNTALRLGGGLATGAGLAKGGLSIAANLPEGAGLLARLLGFGGEGAAYGAADAIGHKDSGSIGDFAQVALNGAERGGFVGAAFPAAGAAVGKAVSAVTPMLSRPIAGANPVTTALLGGLTSPRTAATLDKLGPGSALIDASPSMLGLGQGVAARPGPGADTIVDFVNARHAGQSDRLVGDLGDNLGPAFSPGQFKTMLDAKDAATQPLLAQADARGTMWSPILDQLSRRPAVQKALRSASDAAANEGNPLPMVSLDETGSQVSPSARLAYETYARNARGRLDDALGSMLGSDGALATADQILAQRKALADPLYAQFRQSSIPMTDDLKGLLQRPSVRAALPNAERLAQDEGKSIYVGGSSAGDGTPAGGPRPFAPLEDYLPPDTVARPSTPRPQTLQDFVKSAGGVQDRQGDLAAMGLDLVPGLIAKPGTGLGPDAMRQAAAQAGYLGPDIDHAMANTSINDLVDALGNHPVHSVRDAEAAHRWNAYDMGRQEADAAGRRQTSPARPPSAPLPDFDPNGGPVGEITPEGWDYVKRSLDDRIDTARRGGAGNEARVYGGLKSDLVSALDAASSVYAKARQAYAGQSDLLDALEAGKAAIGRNVSREQLRREFGGLGTDGERAMYRLGAAHGLRETVA